MNNKIRLLFTFLCFYFFVMAQETDKTPLPSITFPPIDSVQPANEALDTIPKHEVPEIIYSNVQKKYTIQDIKVVGAAEYYPDDFALIGFSGLKVGDEINVPGDEITEAINRFWKQGLFSHIAVVASRMEEDNVWLELQLRPRPRISEVIFNGVKKSERTDLEAKLNMRKGLQMSTHLADRAKLLISKYFDEKGFKNVDIDIVDKPDPAKDGDVIVHINIDKKEKTKIQQIYFNGSEQVSAFHLRKAMKKTNERFNMMERFRNSWLELFSTKKFTTAEYEKDKNNLINKYHEFGYRDAAILADSIVPFNQKRVTIHFNIEEGQRFFLKDIRFVGNTKYPSFYLHEVLNMKVGEVYNQKKLLERLYNDDNAVMNIYSNNGYLFAQADPVEAEIVGDSVSLEIRIIEGPQATINKVVINGNDRLYEDIIRRELRTKPGQLFSREDLMRSLRELAQMGHFDPENMKPDVSPNIESGTVDLIYNLTSKANDQVELSLGW